MYSIELQPRDDNWLCNLTRTAFFAYIIQINKNKLPIIDVLCGGELEPKIDPSFPVLK